MMITQTEQKGPTCDTLIESHCLPPKDPFLKVVIYIFLCHKRPSTSPLCPFVNISVLRRKAFLPRIAYYCMINDQSTSIWIMIWTICKYSHRVMMTLLSDASKEDIANNRIYLFICLPLQLNPSIVKSTNKTTPETSPHALFAINQTRLVNETQSLGKKLCFQLF